MRAVMHAGGGMVHKHKGRGLAGASPKGVRAAHAVKHTVHPCKGLHTCLLSHVCTCMHTHCTHACAARHTRTRAVRCHLSMTPLYMSYAIGLRSTGGTCFLSFTSELKPRCDAHSSLYTWSRRRVHAGVFACAPLDVHPFCFMVINATCSAHMELAHKCALILAANPTGGVVHGC